MKWENIPKDEQETMLTFDYYESVMEIYTTKSYVARMLEKILGEGNIKTSYGRAYCEEWKIPFEDSDIIKKVLNIKKLINSRQTAKSI